MSMEFEVLEVNPEDVIVTNVGAPGFALPGAQPVIIVRVQQMAEHGFSDIYCVINDPSIAGSIPYPRQKKSLPGVGGFVEFAMMIDPNHMMPDRAWTLEIEVGILNFWGDEKETDVRYITIEVDEPFKACPEGYYLDEVTQTCVPINGGGGGGVPQNDFIMYALGGAFLLGIAYVFIKKSK